MRQYQGRNPADTYRQQLKDLLDEGDDVFVHGRPTKEFLDVQTQWTHPRERLQIIPGRRLNPWLALSEAIWTLAGRNDIAALLPYNKGIKMFSDDGEVLYGAYGYRISPQIVPLIKRLKADPNDRRCVLTIWDEGDLCAETKDPPCNDVVMFKLRDERLHMTVMNRSNDLHWGLYAVNQFQFGLLQEYIAARLGVGLGNQTHYSQSLHIYTDDQGSKITNRMLAAWDDPIEEVAHGWHFPQVLADHEEFKWLCNGVLAADATVVKATKMPFFEFADDFLRVYRMRSDKERLFEGAIIRHADRYPDWMALGKEFVHAR